MIIIFKKINLIKNFKINSFKLTKHSNSFIRKNKICLTLMFKYNFLGIYLIINYFYYGISKSIYRIKIKRNHRINQRSIKRLTKSITFFKEINFS
jgi:hypothetical protein